MLYFCYLFIKVIKIICIAFPIFSKIPIFEFSSSKNYYSYEIADFGKKLIFEVDKKSESQQTPKNQINYKSNKNYQDVFSYKNYLIGGGILILILISTNIYNYYRIRFFKRYVRKRNLEVRRLRESVRFYKNLPKLNIIDDKVILENEHLNERQKEIVIEMLKGRTNAEIATRLFIAETTVKYHIKNIYKIYDVKNRSQLYKIFTVKS